MCRQLGWFVLFVCMLSIIIIPGIVGAVEGVYVQPEVSDSALEAGLSSPVKELAVIPSSANRNWSSVCVDRSQNLNGDIQSINNFGLGQWSVGPAISTQLFIYDFGKEKAGINQALGAGASFRFYRPITIKDRQGLPIGKDGNAITWTDNMTKITILENQLDVLKSVSTPDLVKIRQTELELQKERVAYQAALQEIDTSTIYISQVKQECRQTTMGRNTTGYLASPLFSITPTIFASEPISQNDLAIQPALLLGLFEDIINIGVGFNLTGPSGQKGNVFLLMGVGAGFNW